ncbi:MAG: YceI family protein, partial [Jeotgalicoccus sp.]
LHSEEFFNAEVYPKVTFESTDVRKAGQTVKVFGDLTIMDHTENIMIILYNKGARTNPWGIEVYGFEGKFELKRSDYGLTWNKPLTNGGVLVSNKVKILASLQFSKS